MAFYDLNQIIVFINVVEQKGVRAAAERLGIAQSSVSRAVSALEKRLGTRMFERTTRAFRVTEEGKLYYERCRNALDGIEQADSTILGRRDELEGTLRISAPVILGKYLLSGVVNSFLVHHPKANVTLELSDRIADMVPEAIDLCLRFAPSPTSSAIVSRVIARPSAGLYASAAYLKAHGTPRVPADLFGHRTLGVGWLKLSPPWVLRGSGGTAKVALKPSLLSNDIDILVSAAIQGCGILMAPHFVCHQERLPETLLQVLPEWESEPVQLRAVYPSRQSVTPLLRAFIDLPADRASKVLNIQPNYRKEKSE